jgi:DNA-binding NarL/FixJ family response regulator
MSNGKEIRVLVVDDEDRLRWMAKSLLQAEGDIKIVGEAANGRVAVELNTTLCPDLIVMDIAMPKLNGLEATKLIRKNSPAAKIIIITALAAEPYRKAAMDVGATAFLSKASLDSDLISTIHTMFH